MAELKQVNLAGIVIASDRDYSARRLPIAGDVYQHFKGGKYRIVCAAISGKKGGQEEPLIIYQSLEDQRIYYRRFEDFLDRIKAGDYRFTKCEE